MLIFLEIAFAAITLELGYFSYENLEYNDGPDADDDNFHRYEREKQIARIMRRFKYT